MYRLIGLCVRRFPLPTVVFWVLVAALAYKVSPLKEKVAQDGEFLFLPDYVPSRRAEKLFADAFPPDIVEAPEEGEDLQKHEEDLADRRAYEAARSPLGSSIVIVLRREGEAVEITDDDRTFIKETLLPALERIQRCTPPAKIERDNWDEIKPDDRVTQAIISELSDKYRPLLRSQDNKSTLVVMKLKNEFLNRLNFVTVLRLEYLLKSVNGEWFIPEENWLNPEQLFKNFDKNGDGNLSKAETPERMKKQFVSIDSDKDGRLSKAEIRRAFEPIDFKGKLPDDLRIDVSGSAIVGRDMLRAESLSASRTETFTKVLVIVLLLAIYRSPLLALIPLATVGLTVDLTVWLLRILADYKWVGLFSGLDTYVTVVVYGAGVDYCLFLIARYKEELDKGASFDEALSLSIEKVGAALAASAGTSIFGIFMMSFAEFGKFRQAGVAISFGLLVVLICTLTFTPALLRLSRQWAFWPQNRKEKLGTNWMPDQDLLSAVGDQKWFDRGWKWMAGCLERYPGQIFVYTLLIMAPFVGLAVATHNQLSYGLLSDLQSSEPSVIGTKNLARHFAPGTTGISTVLVHHDAFEFTTPSSGRSFSEAVTTRLQKEKTNLGLDDIRSQKFPLGLTEAANDYWSSLKGPELRVGTNSARDMYTAKTGDLAGKVVRLDLVFNCDPFSRESIPRLTEAEGAIRRAVIQTLAEADSANPVESAEPEPAGPSPATIQSAEAKYHDMKVLSIGPAAGIRDLKTTTDGDQIRIDILVCLVVYAVVVALLRQPAICAFLIVSVVISYLVTIGVTVMVFYVLDPNGFAGIDWKVPIYLFTILIAMGEDYNILLMARVTEEQATHGQVKGILTALTKTGSIISSCGVIMAGTFASLMTGTLLGMVQMGFALAFGVLLDTFVVRPILVPSYLILLYEGKFGRLGPLLGGPRPGEKSTLLASQTAP